MNLSGLIDTLGSAKERIKRDWHRRLRMVGILLCGVVFVVGAAGFGIAAGYMWLTMGLPDYQAALVVAAVLLCIGGIVIAVARSQDHPQPEPTAATAAPDIAHQVDEATNRAVNEALLQVRSSPMSAVLTAVAVGAVVGLLRPSDDS